MSEELFELWQGDKKFVTGTKEELARFTGLKLSTINNYCRPGYLENTKNETNIRVVNVTEGHKMSEVEIQNKILLEASKQGHRLWRTNAGKVKTEYGAWIKLLPKGFPDTCGFRKSDGKFIAIEIKTPNGKLRKEQKQFARFAIDQPIIYGVARSVDEAMELIEKGTNQSTEKLKEELKGE